MPPCDQASETSPLSIARASLGRDRLHRNVVCGAGRGVPSDAGFCEVTGAASRARIIQI